MSDANLNHLCARIAIEECVRRGCRTIVVCPGSRSAPLAAAAAAWHASARAAGAAAVDVIVAHDERGAAFLALGSARVTGRAAVVITTSGTAVANLLPAAVEASMDGIPMLLFTADRPPELHGCGANQAVPQAGMLEPVVRSAIDVECPDEPGATPLDSLDAVARAWSCAHGSDGAPGPVHVNWRYREPLAPVAVPWSVAPAVAQRLASWQSSQSPWVVADAPRARRERSAHAERNAAQAHSDARSRTGDRGWDPATHGEVDALCELLANAKRGVVVAGGARSPEDAADLTRIACALQWPVIADITSGLRGSAAPANTVHHADLALCARASGSGQPAADGDALGALRPDAILRIGGRITSKRVQQWIDDAAASGCTLAVAGGGIEPMDPSRRASVLVRTSARSLADRLTGGSIACARSDAIDAWLRADSAVARALAEATDAREPSRSAQLTEPAIARMALREAHRADATVMLSSSMPVRDADMHADRDATPWCIANRGASGIDGIVATAAGACRSRGKPVLLLIGDVAALHDLASWSLLRDLPAPMCMVVVNNDGGGIFRFLPIAEHTAIYSPWFDSPHGLSFEGAARMFSLGYEASAEGLGLAAAIRKSLNGEGANPSFTGRHCARIVEVRVAAERIIPDHRAIQAACARAVRDALAIRTAQGIGR